MGQEIYGPASFISRDPPPLHDIYSLGPAVSLGRHRMVVECCYLSFDPDFEETGRVQGRRKRRTETRERIGYP